MNGLKKGLVLAALAAASACTQVVFPDVISEDEAIATREPAVAEQKGEPVAAPVLIDVPEHAADDVSTSASYDDGKQVMIAAAPDSADGGDGFAPTATYRSNVFYFGNGSAALDGQYAKDIREIAKIAKARNARVYVYGYSSSRTGNTDLATHKMMNFKVSQERAEAVAQALRRAGVKADRLFVEALSDSNPAYLEVMPEGDRLNRRAEVYISY